MLNMFEEDSSRSDKISLETNNSPYASIKSFSTKDKKLSNVLSLLDTLNIDVAIKYLNIDRQTIEKFLSKNGFKKKKILDNVIKYVDKELNKKDFVPDDDQKKVKRKFCQALMFKSKLPPAEHNVNEKIAIFSGYYLLNKGDIQSTYNHPEYEKLCLLWLFGISDKNTYIINEFCKCMHNKKILSDIDKCFSKCPFLMTPILTQLYLLNIKHDLHKPLLIEVLNGKPVSEDTLRISFKFYDKLLNDPYSYRLTPFKTCEYIALCTGVEFDEEIRRKKRLQEYIDKLM